jgi:hypothetical protein
VQNLWLLRHLKPNLFWAFLRCLAFVPEKMFDSNEKIKMQKIPTVFARWKWGKIVLTEFLKWTAGIGA